MKRFGIHFVGTCIWTCANAAQAAVLVPPAGPIDGAAAATVMQANPAGIGHINLVPYYSVQGGYDTYLNLVNTDTRNGKAVKLRFRAAANGDTVMDFTVLLAPGDMWSAGLTKDTATGLPRLVYGDKSCTLPATVQTVFRTDRLVSPATNAFSPAQQASAGHVEILTMADIPPGATPLFTAILPVAGVAPCTAASLQTLADDPASYADARGKGLEAPTTGLMTRWTLINVARAAAYTGVATAIEARVTTHGVAGYGNLVFSPQTADGVSDLAQRRAHTADPLLRGAVLDNATASGQSLDGVAASVQAVRSDFPDLSTPYLPSGPDPATSAGAAPRVQIHALSQALATSSVANEFVINPAIAARTDWVVTLPTRRYNAAMRPAAQGPSPVFTNWTTNDLGAPLGLGTANFFTPANSPVLSTDTLCTLGMQLDHNDLAGAGRRSGGLFADSEGNLKSRWVPLVSPADPPFSLCTQAAVLNFRAVLPAGETSVLAPAMNLSGPFLFQDKLSGWARLATPGLNGLGLPLIGFAAMELFNAAATPGVAGIYGQAFPHSTTPAP